MLTLSREALAIDVDEGIRGEQVIAAMARIALSRGAPRTIRVDDGPIYLSVTEGVDRYGEALVILALLGLFVPLLAVEARRFHDIDQSRVSLGLPCEFWQERSVQTRQI